MRLIACLVLAVAMVWCVAVRAASIGTAAPSPVRPNPNPAPGSRIADDDPLFAPATGGPFADVPLNHPAYTSSAFLQRLGIFTGYPDGTFDGKRVLTRYEFAVAIQRMVQELDRRVGAVKVMAGPGARAISPMEKLRQARRLQLAFRWISPLPLEFKPTLVMLGADVDHLLRNLADLSAVADAEVQAAQAKLDAAKTEGKAAESAK